MLADLLASVREQAGRSATPVRAAALMRIARVESVTQPAQARETFRQGLEETRRLPSPGRERLLEQAQLLAAAVAPDLLSDIPSFGQIPRHIAAERIGRTMLEHEHGDAAFEYLLDYDEPSTFPYSIAWMLLEWYGDELRRRAVIRFAIEAWRAAPNDRFLSLFHARWKLLPPEEALALVREVVRVTLRQPDWAISATYDPEGTVRLTSGRQHNLFQILHVLRQLDEPLAQSLIESQEQLAMAARRYPNGMESVMEEARIRQANAAGASCGGGFGIGGSMHDFPYLESLMHASLSGDFDPPIEHALDRYRHDAAPDRPNTALLEFWPSTCNFRSILYSAGNRLGMAAAVYLDRIPDAGIRLFAEIELCAALVGLPELQGTQQGCCYRPGSA